MRCNPRSGSALEVSAAIVLCSQRMPAVLRRMPLATGLQATLSLVPKVPSRYLAFKGASRERLTCFRLQQLIFGTEILHIAGGSQRSSRVHHLICTSGAVRFTQTSGHPWGCHSTGVGERSSLQYTPGTGGTHGVRHGFGNLHSYEPCARRRHLE